MKPASAYLLRRMAQRGIASAEIDQALGHRETTYVLPEHPDRMVVLGRTAAGRRLKIVVYVDDQDFVITVADRDNEA